jgi:antitoxin StbD
MSKLVAIGEARARLSQLVRDVGDQHIVLMNNCRPAAILVSPQRYSPLVEEIEDLRDRLSVLERGHATVLFSVLVVELGIAEDVAQAPPWDALLTNHASDSERPVTT